MKIFHYLFFLIILYVYINNPIFIEGFGACKFLYPLAFIFFIFNNDFLLKFKLYKSDILIYVILILYVCLRVIIGADFSGLRAIIVAFIENIIIALFIVCYYFKYLKDFDFSKILIVLGVVGSFISVAMFFNEDIYRYFNSIQKNSVDFNDLVFRSYGLAEGLTYSYAISQAIIFTIMLNEIYKYKYFLFLFPLLIFSVIINARTGIIVLFIGLFFWLYTKKKFSIIIFLLMIYVILYSFLSFIDIASVNEVTYIWIMDFFYNMSDIFFGTNYLEYSTTSTLLDMAKVIPDNISELLVGKGISMFGVIGGSDIGYNRIINYGGIIYLLLLILVIINMYYKMKKINIKSKYLMFFLVVILFSNIKGAFLPNSSGLRLIFLIYIFVTENYYYLNDERKKYLLFNSN